MLLLIISARFITSDSMKARDQQASPALSFDLGKSVLLNGTKGAGERGRGLNHIALRFGTVWTSGRTCSRIFCSARRRRLLAAAVLQDRIWAISGPVQS